MVVSYHSFEQHHTMSQKKQGESTPFFSREGRVTSAGGAPPATTAAAAAAAVDRRRFAGPMSALGLAVGIFVIATGGVVTTTTTTNNNNNNSRRRVPVVAPDVEDSLPAAAAELSVTSSHETWECATSSKPVLNSTDVVAYFSLEEGEGAVYGMQEHEVVYGGYLFRFVSEENKALFEESPLDYIPAWGGFCGYGIAWEDYWTKDNLGPDADPEWWVITDDNALRLFRSELPKQLFLEEAQSSINTGDEIWESWWGEGALPGANDTGTPIDTDCLCNVHICLNQ